jgi:phosphomannomutase
MESLCRGIRDQGASVIDLGIVDTPMVIFAVNHLACAGGIQVTASHNPAKYNGFKFCRSAGRPIGSGSGLETIRENAAMVAQERTESAGGMSEKRDLWEAYARRLHERLAMEVPEGLAEKNGRPIKIVVDASNGSAGVMVPRVFDSIEGLDLTELNFEHDKGTFVHEPNPLVESNLDQLRAAVKGEKADAGVCFDGDADRCVVVDESGRTIGGDLLTALLLEPILEHAPGAGIVHDLRASRIVPERIESLGGVAIPSRVGHVFMKATLSENGAVFGGELSGHYYYADMFNADNGARAFISVLGVIARSERPLSDLVEPLRKYVQSGEINFQTDDVEESLDSVRRSFPDADFDDMDGLLVDTGAWWANIRASNTEPLLRLNVESKDSEVLDAAVSDLEILLGKRVTH